MDKEKIVAVIDKDKISIEDIKKNIEILPEEYKSQFRTFDEKKNLLQDIVTTEMLFLAGKEKSLDRDEKIILKVDNFRKLLVRDLYINKYITPKAIPSEYDIREYYKKHKNDMFFKKGYVDIFYINTETEEDAQQVCSMLKKYKFDEIAGKLLNNIKSSSEIKSPLRVYKDEEIPKVGMNREFIETAFSLKFNEISKPIKTRDGYYIIKLIGKEPGKYADLDAVRGAIKNTLEKEKFLKLMDEDVTALKSRYNVKTYPELLK
ncbi:MAG: hypothetical protein A2W05_09860 [Candidatus Schekmanbacteria bacterium RBG_16_38_10]|uniref:peptidylprolyl isomerase n=1 Tax=Candidatus Schekmanbacteria bacterium RBG_16_38_10 TaxID=1817879 RepID=A0A1F7RN29_9BACT|nr:MAG: hypothetical protein A2W05_09860 [Candidatus Schekmanbacteria bacterium RBG_16_38_10]